MHLVESRSRSWNQEIYSPTQCMREREYTIHGNSIRRMYNMRRPLNPAHASGGIVDSWLWLRYLQRNKCKWENNQHGIMSRHECFWMSQYRFWSAVKPVHAFGEITEIWLMSSHLQYERKDHWHCYFAVLFTCCSMFTLTKLLLLLEFPLVSMSVIESDNRRLLRSMSIRFQQHW